MTTSTLSSETIHVSAVAIDGHGVLIGGLSGKGKSDLALRLIDRGARLISDDYTFVRRNGEQLIASAPPTIAGKIEVRSVGLVDMPAVSDVPVALFVDLDVEPERLPEPGEARLLAGIAVPVVGLSALEPSAPIKVEIALRMLGLNS